MQCILIIEARRVRCDEAKPWCRNCTSKGRTCGGYESLAHFRTSQSIFPALQEIFFDTSQEVESFQFFQHRTCSQLAGFYQSEPWTRLVFQLLPLDASIRHAAIALASIHQNVERIGSPSMLLDAFGLQQYDIAIRRHMADIANSECTTGDLVSYMVACILFISIEVIQFHYYSASSLIKQAVRLLQRMLGRADAGSIWPVGVFERFICRLQGQATAVVDSSMFHGLDPPRIHRTVIPAIPQQFESVTQAREYFELYRTWYDITHWRNETSQFSPSERTDVIQSYYHVMSRYSLALDGLQQHEGELDEQDRRALALLRIRQQLWLNWQDITRASSTTDKDEDAWDLKKSTVEAILNLSRIAMGLPESEIRSINTISRPMYSFSLDFGIISPLSDVARLCRDPVLRRRAIQLLRLCPCREGLADSLWSARVCERVMELEEAGVLGEVKSASDIPANVRIRKVVADFSPVGRGVLMSYYRSGISIPQQERLIV